jgi:hypothetical protein
MVIESSPPSQVSGGGIPGWVIASNATIRRSDPEFRKAWEPYWKLVGELIRKNQVDEGGPIILVQIENGELIEWLGGGGRARLTNGEGRVEYVINSAGEVEWKDAWSKGEMPDHNGSR